MILLLALFGWMDLLIIGKWLAPKQIEINSMVGTAEYNQIFLAPPIITSMIDMFLAFGSNLNANGSVKYSYVFSGQQAISIILLITAFICVPMMLLVKPLVLKSRMDKLNH